MAIPPTPQPDAPPLSPEERRRRRRRRRNRRARRRRMNNPLRPLTMPQLIRLAQRLVESQMAPERRMIQRDANRRSQMIQGFSNAVAGELNTAAGNANFGGGSADFGGALNGGGAALSGMADIQGNALGTAGGALAESAGEQGGFALQQGLSDFTSLQHHTLSALEELAARRPEIMREVIQDLLNFELQKSATGIQAGYLGVAQGQLGLDTALGFGGLAEDKRKDKADKKKERKEKRAQFFQDQRDAALGMAMDLSEGRPNPNYDPNIPAGPGNPKTVHLPWAVAMRRLWAAFAPALLQRNFPRARVRRMMRQALIAAGFKPPPPSGGPGVPPGGPGGTPGGGPPE